MQANVSYTQKKQNKKTKNETKTKTCTSYSQIPKWHWETNELELQNEY